MAQLKLNINQEIMVNVEDLTNEQLVELIGKDRFAELVREHDWSNKDKYSFVSAWWGNKNIGSRERIVGDFVEFIYSGMY